MAKSNFNFGEVKFILVGGENKLSFCQVVKVKQTLKYIQSNLTENEFNTVHKSAKVVINIIVFVCFGTSRYILAFPFYNECHLMASMNGIIGNHFLTALQELPYIIEIISEKVR